MQRRHFLTGLIGISALPFGGQTGHAADDAKGPPWSYNPDAADGPEGWADLLDQEGKKPYARCRDGIQQSPIEVELGAFPLPWKPLELNWHNADGLVVNDSPHHAIKVVVKDRTMITRINNVDYIAQEYHLHTPSEHTRRGLHGLMEVHVIHTKADGRKLVVGVMIESGNDRGNGLFAQLLKAPKMPEPGAPWPGLLNATLMPDARFGYFRYNGSLTTPACAEVVDWIVLDQPARAVISAPQIEIYKARYPYAGPPIPPDQTLLTRPTQPVNGRVIRWYKRP
jgi:carbonic anhydrase